MLMNILGEKERPAFPVTKDPVLKSQPMQK